MPRRRFRDRFFTPPVARAMTSPLGILLAGAGAAAGVLAGGGLPAAAAIGAAAWAARVAAAVPRDPRAERIDPYSLSEPWRGAMRDALEAQRAFREAVAGTQAGPLRDRLDAVGSRIGDGVDEAWRVARHGHALVAARRRIDTEAARRELDEVAGRSGSALERTAQALEAQLESAARMDRAVSEARDRLRLTNARLDEAVARAVELSVAGHTVDEATGLGADVEVMVSDLEALRQGLEELA